MTTHYIETFFRKWQDRDAQKELLQDATDDTLGSILIVTNDIRAAILTEYDHRGPKEKTA